MFNSSKPTHALIELKKSIGVEHHLSPDDINEVFKIDSSAV